MLNKAATGWTALPQQTLEWCWAGVAVGVATGLKLPTIPTEGDLANLLTGLQICNSTPTPKECIRPIENYGEIGRIYEQIGIGAILDRPLAEATLRAELDAGRPVQNCVRWEGGGGHTYLVVGYEEMGLPGDDKDVTVMYNTSDPWFGDSRQTYAQLIHAYGVGIWDASIGRFVELRKR